MALEFKWRHAPDLEELAIRVIARRKEVAHVDTEEIMFLREIASQPKALARTYILVGHPIGVFTDKMFAIVFYQQNCVYMNENQQALLMLHELMHIPEQGDRLKKHDVEDFRAVLGINLDWAQPNQEVPDILGDELCHKMRRKRDSPARKENS
jgi:predicted metallopeptidase